MLNDLQSVSKWLLDSQHCCLLLSCLLVFSRVFVLADPAVFSAPLEATVKAYLNMSSQLRNIRTMEKTVLFHVLQTGLEMTCESSRLAQALEVNMCIGASPEDES